MMSRHSKAFHHLPLLDSPAAMIPKRPTALLLLSILSIALLPAQALPQTGIAPGALEPPSTGGVAAVDRALARLSTHR